MPRHRSGSKAARLTERRGEAFVGCRTRRGLGRAALRRHDCASCPLNLVGRIAGTARSPWRCWHGDGPDRPLGGEQAMGTNALCGKIGGDYFLVVGFETGARRRSACRHCVSNNRGSFCCLLHCRVFPALKQRPPRGRRGPSPVSETSRAHPAPPGRTRLTMLSYRS
jgi:hypothetical protein